MPQFALLYVGEPPHADPEAAQAGQKRWFEWIGSLGDAVVNPGMPLGPATRVTADGVAPAPTDARLTGLTIVEADDMDAAVAMAQSSPYIEYAAVDVAQIFQMG